MAPIAWAEDESAPPTISTEKKAAAKAAFDAGKTAYNLQKYHSAAAHFANSYEISGNPDLLFNIAQAYRLAGANDNAIAAYKTFLREVPESPNRNLAETKLEELQIAQLRPPPKIHQKVVARESPTPRAEAEVLVEPTNAMKPAQPSSWHRPEWLAWAGSAATGAFALGAIVTGLSAQSTFDKLTSTCGQTIAGCTNEQIDGLNREARWANVLWVLAGLAAVGTGVVVYLDYSEQQRALAVAGRF